MESSRRMAHDPDWMLIKHQLLICVISLIQRGQSDLLRNLQDFNLVQLRGGSQGRPFVWTLVWPSRKCGGMSGRQWKQQSLEQLQMPTHIPP